MQTTVFTMLAAFVSCVILTPILIPTLIKFKFGQNILEELKHHRKKAGTPTMGGIMIIFSSILAALIFAHSTPEVVMAVCTIAGFALLGLTDDMMKIKRGKNKGLRPNQKLVGQIVIAIIFILFWRTMYSFSTEILIPFFPDSSLDLGSAYPVFAILVFLSATNGANLTDGVDGLASSVTIIIALFFVGAAVVLNSAVAPVGGAIAGALLAFLIFNSYPGKIMMGDTGSLALGGFVAVMALILQMPLFLLLVAVIYVAESLSVIIQVSYFKRTGKRVFKMAPIHHSFELSGWSETKIVALFTVVTVLGASVGYIALVGFR